MVSIGISHWADRTIRWGFHLLFFLVPLILTPWNYELFEYNKMMITYACTVVIVGAWIVRIILRPQPKDPVDNKQRSGFFASLRMTMKTPFDIPIALFLISQMLSTLFSIDRHVSLWGYYSRFNGGLVSTISYVLLYCAFVHNVRRKQIKGLLTTLLTGAALVSLYGVAEHFGIDKNLWVQDVQNRVFSTLGQPNWLAAYLAILIPVSLGLSLVKNGNSKTKTDNEKISIRWPHFALTILLYVTLIFTKSRSGLLGVWFALAVLGIILFIHYKQRIIQSVSLFLFSCVLFHFLYGTPFATLNRFTLSHLAAVKQSNNEAIGQNDQQPTANDQLLDVGITESADIRKIVWRGAMDIIRHYPILGSGVETFAFSYYQFRPAEHNMTSEWDFLYNKAHNEYLNYAATTGVVGVGAYLLLIGSVIFWYAKKIKFQNSKFKSTPNNKNSNAQKHVHFLNFACDLSFEFWILSLGLFSGWLSILVTNFFGFSVVIVQLYFFLIPAILFVLTHADGPTTPVSAPASAKTDNRHLTTATRQQKALTICTMLVALSLLWKIGRAWYADTVFAHGYHASRSAEYAQAYTSLSRAIRINQSEPFYYDELAIAASQLVLSIDPQTDATFAADIQNQAVAASDIAIAVSPNNVNFWKTRTRILYTLSQLDELYLPGTLVAIEKAKSLSPTDPKIRYNLALVYNNLEKHQEAYRQLEEAVRLKPNYKDPVYAMALFYQRDLQTDKAKEQLNYILTHIDPNDAEAKKLLEELP